MSITGKDSLSIVKKDVIGQSNIGATVKSIKFAHKASLGETSILVGSLVLPSEMSGNGFANPSTVEILNAKMRANRNKLKVVSSLRGELMDYLSYVIKSNSEIGFIGFEAEEGEIFTCTITESVNTNLSTVDARPLIATGVLLDTTTDFNVGTPFPINQSSSQQIGAIAVYRNGLLQARNTGNSASVLDGNYYEVDNGDGFGTLIRFNNAASGDESVYVTSIGNLVEKANSSQLAEIEAAQGQIDAMIPTLAALAGVPETDFQAAPNSQDLKAFGDRVLALENKVDNGFNDNSVYAQVAGNTFENLQSTTIQPGIYIMSAAARFRSLTTAPNDIQLAFSVNSGNNTSDHIDSKNSIYGAVSITNEDTTLVIPAQLVIVTTATPYYLKSYFLTQDAGTSVLSWSFNAIKIADV